MHKITEDPKFGDVKSAFYYTYISFRVFLSFTVLCTSWNYENSLQLQSKTCAMQRFVFLFM